ncbi:EF-hand domain-containing protein [Luteibacter aegosomaticola]|uniref:EF-hand domain-containing protein n=1 Tax=Luteibacter aegosomaticola TaxID=2911538 RepID=UPI001FF89923|nr:EF-hand domain-containing protein [Luteibacter aegosomaticola]UPG88811.1 EF-hand domain-containing protein [Luteibacter aegosomaticola]
MKCTRFIVLSAAGTLFAGSAFAQLSQAPAARAQPVNAEVRGSDAPAFADIVKKHPGYLERSDVPRDDKTLAILRAHFKEADANGDGHVDEQEYKAYMAKSH